MKNLDEHFDDLRESYHAPGEPPTDLMWARIQQRRGQGRRLPVRWMAWSVAAAAVLILGIGIGRMSVDGPPPGVVATVENPTADPPATTGPDLLHFAAGEFLRRSEVLLTEARNQPIGPANLDTWASRMLLQTRLFLDTPLVEDPELHILLLDLEFVFAQIAESQAIESGEQNRIAQNLEKNDLMLRLRSGIPATTVREPAQEGRM